MKSAASVAAQRKSINRELKSKTLKKYLNAMFSRGLVRVASVVVLLIILAAIFAPLIAPHAPEATNFSAPLAAPSREYPLGTDMLGRCLLSRIIYGARVSLIVGVLAVIIASVIGSLLGMCAAYIGKWVDMVVMRFCEAVMAIPPTILTVALVAVMGGGLRNLAIILGLTPIPAYVRMMRAQTLSVKQNDYVIAAKLEGNRQLPLMLKHILPNAVSPIIVLMTQQVGKTILMEAGMSYLGVGISVPTASWGTLVNDGQSFLLSNPLIAILPGLCVAILVVSLNIVGDGVRDALDPRLRGEL